MSRNKEHRGAAFGGAPNGAAAFGDRSIGSVFFVSAHVFFYIMNTYGYSLYISYIFHIYFLNIFDLFPFVVNSRSRHDRSPTFDSISHVAGLKLTFW